MTKETHDKATELFEQVEEAKAQLPKVMDADAQIEICCGNSWLKLPENMEKDIRQFLQEAYENQIHDLEVLVEAL